MLVTVREEKVSKAERVSRREQALRERTEVDDVENERDRLAKGVGGDGTALGELSVLADLLGVVEDEAAAAMLVSTAAGREGREWRTQRRQQHLRRRRQSRGCSKCGGPCEA
jgi:hypothetical protein